MRSLARVWLGVILALVVHTSGSATPLNISPVYQDTPEWCWAAVGEMIFQFFGIPNPSTTHDYQCSILNGIGGSCAADCSVCSNHSGGTTEQVASMLEHFPDLTNSPEIHGHFDYFPLSMVTIEQNIDHNEPVVAGITPYGPVSQLGAAHVVLIVGYDISDPDNPTLTVNDPYPYSITNIPDPYSANQGSQIRSGQYTISYNAFVNILNWTTSIYNLHTGASNNTDYNPPDEQQTPDSSQSQVDLSNVKLSDFADFLGIEKGSTEEEVAQLLLPPDHVDQAIHYYTNVYSLTSSIGSAENMLSVRFTNSGIVKNITLFAGFDPDSTDELATKYNIADPKIHFLGLLQSQVIAILGPPDIAGRDGSMVYFRAFGTGLNQVPSYRWPYYSALHFAFNDDGKCTEIAFFFH